MKNTDSEQIVTGFYLKNVFRKVVETVITVTTLLTSYLTLNLKLVDKLALHG